MRNVVSVATYLREYGITREEFDEEIEKSKSFYDDYIQWGSKKDGSDSVISPKALEKLGETFNDPHDEPKMTITIDGTVQEEVSLSDNTVSEPKRKRRTKTEIEADRDIKEETVDMSEFMEKPKDDTQKAEPEDKTVKKKTKTATKPRKKTKLNITRQFIQEHGKCNFTKDNIKELRIFLMNGGLYKLEQIAFMSDEEVLSAVTKDFFFIESTEGTYIIKKSVMTGNMSDIFVIEK